MELHSPMATSPRVLAVWSCICHPPSLDQVPSSMTWLGITSFISKGHISPARPRDPLAAMELTLQEGSAWGPPSLLFPVKLEEHLVRT